MTESEFLALAESTLDRIEQCLDKLNDEDVVDVECRRSGNVLEMVAIEADCDRDTLLVQARPRGPTCHLGTTSCFPSAPGDVLGNRQTIQNWIAESRAEINASRLMVLHAAWKIDNVGAKEAREEISLIKFYVADVMMKIIDRAIQVHGALGVTDDTILSYFYRFERGARIYDGPDEVHKSVVSRRALKHYGMK